MIKPFKRVLIYRLGSLGDTIVALPALHLIERAFPRAERTLLTNVPAHTKAPAAAAILEGSGLIHRYIDYPVGTRSALELLRLWWRIARMRPQVVIYLMQKRGEHSLLRDRRFFRVAGTRRIVGLAAKDIGANRYDSSIGQWESEATWLLRSIGELGALDVEDLRFWDLHLTLAEIEKACEALAPVGNSRFIACGPGTKMQSKDWGAENWRELLSRLSPELPDHALVLVGAKEDVGDAEYASRSWTGPVVNVCGQLTPRETAAVLKSAELFLGPDSGPMHLAAAYGVPCVIAFAALDLPGRWFPVGNRHRPIYHKVECANCRLTECIVQKKKCILSISVDEMLKAALEALEFSRSASSR